MIRKIKNIITNSFKRHNFAVMSEKVVTRWRERKLESDRARVLEWCEGQVRPLEPFLQRTHSLLWDETQKTCRGIENRAQLKLANIGVRLGGGGNYPLLYFLVRLLRPDTVVETGVAAGWSSQAILTALQANGDAGRLFSSDFPYFRCENPEDLIGCVVDDELKQFWSLYIDGDRFNLPQILENCSAIDLFHYDSDKSYQGRVFALETIAAKLSNNALVVFDDIQDNFHFRDLVAQRTWPYKVFAFEGKYVGLTGPGAAVYVA